MIWPTYRSDWAVDPLQEVQRLQRAMNRLFEETTAAPAFPAVNLWSNENEAVLTAELPGVNPADVNVQVRDHVLTLEGKRDAEKLGENDQYHRQERVVGTFSRQLRLPFEVEHDKVAAHYRNGILRVTLPRREASKPRRIAIGSS